MKFNYQGSSWFIKKAPSCFISRAGKEDVSIYKEGNWGQRDADGKLYRRCRVLSAEDGEIVRAYESIPPYITVEWLKEAGFIDIALNSVLNAPPLTDLV